MPEQKRHRWAWLLGAVIIAQLTVPTIALLQDKPARFGFQMYSGHGTGNIRVLDAEGAPVEVDWGDLLPMSLRPELDWTRHVPEYLCANVDGAAMIEVVREEEGPVIVPCD